MKTREAIASAACVTMAIAMLMMSGVTMLAETLRGIALFQERITLLDCLTLEAVIEDVACAETSRDPITATRFATEGQPPSMLEIPYEPAVVLEGTAPDQVTVVLRSVAGAADVPERSLPAHGLRLPASFRGTLPCADCDGIRHHLDLWPDQVYQLSREWLGRPDGPFRRDELGRWYADPERDAIVLYGASEMPLFWQVIAPSRLRRMDMQGKAIVSELDYELTSDGRWDPTDLERLFLAGEALLSPDGLALRECLTGWMFLLETAGDLPALAAAVQAGRMSSQTLIIVSLEARISQPPPGVSPAFPRVALRFNRASPGQVCARPTPVADLINTY